jgi:hypothetical protein
MPRLEWHGGGHLHIIVQSEPYFPANRPVLPGLTMSIELDNTDPKRQAEFCKAMKATRGITFMLPPPRP